MTSAPSGRVGHEHLRPDRGRGLGLAVLPGKSPQRSGVDPVAADLPEQLRQEVALERPELERTAGPAVGRVSKLALDEADRIDADQAAEVESAGHQPDFLYFSASSCWSDLPLSCDRPICVRAAGLPPNSTDRRATRATAWLQPLNAGCSVAPRDPRTQSSPSSSSARARSARPGDAELPKQRQVDRLEGARLCQRHGDLVPGLTFDRPEVRRRFRDRLERRSESVETDGVSRGCLGASGSRRGQVGEAFDYRRPSRITGSGKTSVGATGTAGPRRFLASFWAPAVRRAGISPAPTFHDLRHTSAALAIMEGTHPKAIQARLGHLSITTTLNTYGHLFPSLDVELAERLGEARAARLRHAGGPTVVPIEAGKR
jgi:Phage integrase family